MAARLAPVLAAAGLCFGLRSCAGGGQAAPKLASSPPPAFTNVAPALGIRYSGNEPRERPRDILNTNGSGCAFVDFDGDGRLDLLFVGEPRCALYRNTGAGFEAVPQAAGLDRPGRWIGAGAGDWDNDGDADLCISGYGCGALYRNDGGRFTDVTAAAGVRLPRWSQSPAFGDIDGDGKLDLYVGAYARFDPRVIRYCPRGRVPTVCGPEMYQPETGRLYRNLGAGRFQDVTGASGAASAHGRSWGVMFQDFDDDGRQDFYVANDMIDGDLFHNLGGGRFCNVGSPSGTAFDGTGRRIGGMAVDWADYDNDGRPDLFVTAFSAEHSVLFRQLSPGLFQDSSDDAGVSAPTIPLVGFGARFLDYDNDGWRDLILGNGHVMDNVEKVSGSETYRQPLLLLRNRAGRFEDVSAAALRGLPAIVARGAATGDYDNDGRTDVLMMDLEGQPLLLHNEAPSGHWIGLRLIGSRSNRDGLGARVLVKTAAATQRLECQTSGSLLSSSDPRVLAGLGDSTRVDSVEIRWPSGGTSRLEAPSVDRLHTVAEPQRFPGRTEQKRAGSPGSRPASDDR